MIKSKLYILLYRVSILVMVLSPLLMLLFVYQSDKNKFEEPSLRTNLLEVPWFNQKNFDRSLKQTDNQYELQREGKVMTYHIPGVIQAECLMVGFQLSTDEATAKYQRTFIESLIRVINRYSEERVLVKSIVIVAYPTVRDLNNWLDDYETQPTGATYGVIRAAINLNL